MDDDVAQPSQYLISLAIEAIGQAGKMSLKEISSRMESPPYFPDIWPGEHYKLLASLVSILKPKSIVEIGTYTGLSALALKKYLPSRSKLYTFDVVHWRSFSHTCLREKDFEDNTLLQYVEDLSDPNIMAKHEGIMSEAELLFIDAAKDGVTEQKLIDNLRTVSFKRRTLLVFDDIRLWNMLKIWRGISHPKLDMTSFGHWSGTGFVEWNSLRKQ